VEATKPGHPDDEETKVFEARMQKEAEDMKLESFGVEVRSWSVVATPLTDYPIAAPAHDWARLHDEGDILHEVAQVSGYSGLLLSSERKGHPGQGCVGCHRERARRPGVDRGM
jgi:hypothetical protein